MIYGGSVGLTTHIASTLRVFVVRDPDYGLTLEFSAESKYELHEALHVLSKEIRALAESVNLVV